MNRSEFMRGLAALLQEIPQEERESAMRYYNDYFDDAGAENEAQVIAELESPAKVAGKLKAELERNGQPEGEYTERGYQDGRFEQKETPAQTGYKYASGGQTEQPDNRKAKILLIIGILVVGVPIVVPVALALLGALAAVLLAVAAAVLGVFVSVAAVFLSGLVVAVSGIVQIFSDPVSGIFVTGTGLLMAGVGLAGVLLIGWALAKVVPALFRGCVRLCRKLFRRGEM